MDLPKQAGPRY